MKHERENDLEMKVHNPNEFTFMISRNLKPGREKEYDDWLRRYLALEIKAPGYLGTTVILPGGTRSTTRYIIIRFVDKASMRAWRESDQSAELLKEADKYSTPHYDSAHGMETWFTLPDLRALGPPPKWKMALIVFMAAYAISLPSHYLIDPYLEGWPILFSSIAFTGILVIGLTYFAMPILSRVFGRWLYPSSAPTKI
jgi:antibiotic biosynthesis monooxygenase (ABM) superfamily enzyme